LSRLLGISFFLLFLVGCAAPPVAPTEVRATVKIERDDFKKMTRYTGSDLSSSSDAVLIRAWKNDGATMVYQIYVADFYSGPWRFYTQGFDSDGKRYATTLIDREVRSCTRYGCSHVETIGLNVDRKYLEGKRVTGVTLKLSGRAGEEVFYIPPLYLSTFLDQVPE
jgi:hypothetical protein